MDILDPVFDHASTRLALATLWRRETLTTDWVLCRLRVGGLPTRVFVLPSANVAQPPASLWLGNLREGALQLSWCEPSDLWCEVVRAGWAGYDFNRIQESIFTASGGAIDGRSLSTWSAYCEQSGLSPELLCALPWDGLPAMWGPGFGPTWSRRETIAMEHAMAKKTTSGSESLFETSRRILKA